MLTELEIKSIAASVCRQAAGDPGPDRPVWLLDRMEECVASASEAQKGLAAMTEEEITAVVQAFRSAAMAHAEELALAELEETGYGCLADKIAKCRLAADRTKGPEDCAPGCVVNGQALLVETPMPYGVIGATTPSTNPVATIVSNAIAMVSAGNTVVFAPHPDSVRCAQQAIGLLNRAAVEAGAGGPLLFAMREPDAAGRESLLTDPRVGLLNVTGGGNFAGRALRSGKRVIAAGAGNPPCVVDETADLEAAARDIVRGASFENNIMCISEKEVFVVASVGNALLRAMERVGAQYLSEEQTRRLLRYITVKKNGRDAVNRACIGKSARALLDLAGIPARGEPRLLITRTSRDHPFVQLELMMPVLPVVFVADAREAIGAAVQAEHGNHHSSSVFSRNEAVVQQAAEALQTSLFAVNGASLDSVGAGPIGYCSFTLATLTGEGITRPMNYTRMTRRVKKGAVL